MHNIDQVLEISRNVAQMLTETVSFADVEKEDVTKNELISACAHLFK
jgi:hypothetical protein